MPLLLGSGDSLARNSLGGLGNPFYFPSQAVSRTILLSEPSFNNLVTYSGWKGVTPYPMLPSGYPLWQNMLPLSRLQQLSLGTKHPGIEKKSLHGVYPTLAPSTTSGIGPPGLSLSKHQNGEHCSSSYRFILPTEENVRALSKNSPEKHIDLYERPSIKQINSLMVSAQKLESSKKSDTIKPASPTKESASKAVEKNNQNLGHIQNSPTRKRSSSWPEMQLKVKYQKRSVDSKKVQSYKNLEMDVANILISDIPIPVVGSNGREGGTSKEAAVLESTRRHNSTSSDGSVDIDSDHSSQSDRENVCNNKHGVVFTCQQCAVTCNTTEELLSHKAKHATDFTFTCNVCTQVFRSTNGLQKHVEFHAHDDHRYNCSFCFKRFANKDGLQEHIINMHMSKRPHKCTYCPKAFRDPGSLQKHVRVHTGEKPYQCQDCEKSFAEYSSLRKHLRVHTGEQPYQCKFCPKAFSISGNLQRHILIHTGERPYKCSDCSKAFNNPSHLRRHIKNLHSKLENQK